MIDFEDEDALQAYVKKSAIFTNELGNRRYGQFVFWVDADDVLHSVNVLSKNPCVECKGIGRGAVFDSCEHCEGVGCPLCAGEGGNTVSVPCNFCK